MSSETTVGREAIQIVEIKQPICSRVFGTSPCTATGTGDTKCYNTRSTCQDAENFALDGTPLSLFFGKGGVAEIDIDGVDYLFPSLVSVSTAPTVINFGGSNSDLQGLGNRALCTLVFSDHQHTDRLVDPYLSGRTWDPMSSERGSFWARWVARNKYRSQIQIVIYDGYAGQSLAAMTNRTYFMETITNVDSSGRVTMAGKDILSKVEERKAQAPKTSLGKLYADITAGATSFLLVNAFAADYSSSGVVRVNDELISYASTATVTDGVTFGGLSRGQYRTQAEEHSANDGVQQCIVYSEATVDSVISDLLTTYCGIDAAWLDTANWSDEREDYLDAYRLNTVITEPTSVYKLISEIQAQTLCYIWWDERDALVKMKAVRGYIETPATLTDAANIISGSLQIKDRPRDRTSQCWFYYNPATYLALSKATDFQSQYVTADLETETAELYGTASIRKIFSRWLDDEATVFYTGNRILDGFKYTPQWLHFMLDAKDRTFWLSDDFFLSHYLDLDEYGARRNRKWTIISAEEVIPGETVRYVAIETSPYGQLHFVMDAAAEDFTGYDSAPIKNAYIGDADGLLTGGATAGVIS
jgi:hypothetical protein